MIIRNISVGEDVYGHKLQCGDICEFKINLQRPKCEEKVEEMKGMIIYDKDTYSFAFETLNNYAPVLLMSCVSLKVSKNYLNLIAVIFAIFLMEISGKKFLIVML